MTFIKEQVKYALFKHKLNQDDWKNLNNQYVWKQMDTIHDIFVKWTDPGLRRLSRNTSKQDKVTHVAHFSLLYWYIETGKVCEEI